MDTREEKGKSIIRVFTVAVRMHVDWKTEQPSMLSGLIWLEWRYGRAISYEEDVTVELIGTSQDKSVTGNPHVRLNLVVCSDQIAFDCLGERAIHL